MADLERAAGPEEIWRRRPKTKIVCTLGPASRSVEMCARLLRAGMCVARFNFSHGSHEYHQETLDNLHKAMGITGILCAVMLDTKARGWPHNALCSLCDQELETADHLSLHCSYAKVIWDMFRRSTDGLCSAAATARSISEWWVNTGCGRGSKDRNKEEMTLAAYIVWNLWKERNRRVFEHKEMGPMELAALITDEVNMVKLAMTRALVVRGQH